MPNRCMPRSSATRSAWPSAAGDHGCSPALLSAADGVAYIPQVGRVGSPNVAVATAIALTEARRREWTAAQD